MLGVEGGGPQGQYRSLTQIIVELLRERIFAGEYGPGSRLNIADLAQRFHVSPVPVREALRNLETEGLVQFRLNRGVMVRELSADEVRELFLIRRRLEALAASEAARLIDGDGIAGLEATLGEMDAVAAGTEAWHALHGRFHDRLTRASGLPRLGQLVGVLRGQMRPYARIYLGNSEHLAAAQAEHYALVAALRARDGEAIERIVGEHLSRPAGLAIAAFAKGAAHALEAAR